MFSKFTMLVANENTPAALRAYAAEKLSALSAVYGVYAVDGNHEFHTKQDLSSDEIYKRANITLLHDTLIEVADCFYIAGRNDPRGPEPRAPLSKLLSSAEKESGRFCCCHTARRALLRQKRWRWTWSSPDIPIRPVISRESCDFYDIRCQLWTYAGRKFSDHC